MKKLIDSFEGNKIFEQNGRRYLLIPITDHHNATDTLLLRQAVNAICDIVDWNGGKPITKIVSEEEKGGFIGVCVALQRNIPFSLAKENPVRIPDEIHIEFEMDYNDNMHLYLNGVKKDDRVLIIDDIIATGGTMIALIQAIRKAGAEIKDVVALAEKVELKGVKKIKQETGIDVKTVIQIDSSGEESKVVGTCFEHE